LKQFLALHTPVDNNKIWRTIGFREAKGSSFNTLTILVVQK
jgi:hypothetical protein